MIQDPWKIETIEEKQKLYLSLTDLFRMAIYLFIIMIMIHMDDIFNVIDDKVVKQLVKPNIPRLIRVHRDTLFEMDQDEI